MVCRQWAFSVILLGATLTTSDAQAHLGPRKQVDVQFEEDHVALTVQVSALHAAVALGLGADAASAAIAAEAAPFQRRWMTELVVYATERRCQPVAAEREVAGDGLRVGIHYRCPSLAGLALADLSLGSADGHETHLSVGNGTRRAFRILRTPQPVPLTAPSWAGVATDFLYQGAVHLVTGYDHLLFLMTLVVGAGWASRRHGRRRAMAGAARVVTAFTIGHSITLALATLGYVLLPLAPVEAAIALSIVVAAGLNIIAPEHAHGRPLIALLFGLVHGFGFSAVLADVGLPIDHRALALLFFNFGIEVAQLVLVLVAMIPIAQLAERAWYRPVVATFGSGLAALFGLIWFAERTHLL